MSPIGGKVNYNYNFAVPYEYLEKPAKISRLHQLQQDKKRLCEEAERATVEGGELRQEVELLRGRLEETEWGLCQKTGELSLLKAQLKDSQVRGSLS
jgi:chromosome segregation ATPase